MSAFIELYRCHVIDSGQKLQKAFESMMARQINVEDELLLIQILMLNPSEFKQGEQLRERMLLHLCSSPLRYGQIGS